jgi:hypothetical protein
MVLILHCRGPDLFEAGYKVLATLTMHNTVFWDVMQRSLFNCLTNEYLDGCQTTQ